MSKYNAIAIDLLVEVWIGDLFLGEKAFSAKIGSIRQDLQNMKDKLEAIRTKEMEKEYLDNDLKYDPIHLNLLALKLNHNLIKRTNTFYQLAQAMVFEV